MIVILSFLSFQQINLLPTSSRFCNRRKDMGNRDCEFCIRDSGVEDDCVSKE
jgi:hypothetical protein